MSFNKDNTFDKFDIKKNDLNDTTDKIPTIKESAKGSTLSRLKIIIIIASIVIVVAAAIILIVILTRKSNDHKKNPIINETNVISTDIEEVIQNSAKGILLDTTKETIQSTIKTSRLSSTLLESTTSEKDEVQSIIKESRLSSSSLE